MWVLYVMKGRQLSMGRLPLHDDRFAHAVHGRLFCLPRLGLIRGPCCRLCCLRHLTASTTRGAAVCGRPGTASLRHARHEASRRPKLHSECPRCALTRPQRLVGTSAAAQTELQLRVPALWRCDRSTSASPCYVSLQIGWLGRDSCQLPPWRMAAARQPDAAAPSSSPSLRSLLLHPVQNALCPPRVTPSLRSIALTAYTYVRWS